MTWSDVTRQPRPAVVRQFGVVCLVIFGGLGLFQWLARDRPALGGTLMALGVLCAALGAMAPGRFRWVYTGAMMVAFPLGYVVSQVMLVALFYGVFLPIGLFLRCRGWDAMVRKRRPPTASYWETKPVVSRASRYLRQY